MGMGMSGGCSWMLLIAVTAWRSIRETGSASYCPEGAEIPTGYTQGSSATKHYKLVTDAFPHFFDAQAACAADKAQLAEFASQADWDDVRGLITWEYSHVWVGLWNPDAVSCDATASCDGLLKWWSTDASFTIGGAITTNQPVVTVSSEAPRCMRMYLHNADIGSSSCDGSGETGYLCQYDCNNAASDAETKCPDGSTPPTGYHKARGSGKFYNMKSYSGSPMAQSEALSDCTADSDGGGKSSLMRITTDEEYQTVVAMESLYRTFFWIGLTKSGEDVCSTIDECTGVIQWVDGDSFGGGSFFSDTQIRMDSSTHNCAIWNTGTIQILRKSCIATFHYLCQYRCSLCIDEPHAAPAWSTHDFQTGNPVLEGDTVTYTCDDGYQFESSSTNVAVITCQSTGQWDPSSIGNCKQYQCITSSAHQDQSSSRLNLPASYPGIIDVGSSITYECDANMFLQDGSTDYAVPCLDDFTFGYDSEKSCRNKCDAPPTVEGVSSTVPPENANTPYGHWEGAVTQYQCPNLGYRLEDAAGSVQVDPYDVTCDSSGIWAPSDITTFSCNKYQCVTSEDYVDQSGNRLYPPAEDPVVVDVTGTITYSCASNMFLADFTTSLEVPCGSGLNFGYDDTKKCRELCADDPPTPDGVQNTIPDRHHNEHGYWEETTVSYECVADGYRLEDSRYPGVAITEPFEITCQSDGTWSDSSPSYYACVQYQCILASAHQDQSSSRLNLPQDPPAAVDVGSSITYQCDTGKYLNDWTTSYDVPCQQSGDDFIFQYDAAKYCWAACAADYERPDGVDYDTVDRNHQEYGYKENTIVEYWCSQDGYRLESGGDVIPERFRTTCNSLGEWSHPAVAGYTCEQYQCITASAFQDRTAYRMSPQNPTPVVVDVGSFVVYECDAGKYLGDYAQTLNILCRSDFTFNYDDSKQCVALCDADPPQLEGVTYQWPEKPNELGWWEFTNVEYTCPTPGYQLEDPANAGVSVGNPFIVTCDINGGWSPSGIESYGCNKYQCITAEDYQDRADFRMSPPADDPIVIDQGSSVRYSCYDGMYLPSFANTLDIQCRYVTLDFNYATYDDVSYKCKELCENDPPEVSEATHNAAARDHADLGWWEDVIVEYTCSPDFYFNTTGNDQDTSICRVDGQWTSVGICQRDGEWSAWFDTSACSATCASGEKDQERTCTNPAPMNGGKDCAGASTRVIACNAYPCPIHGEWSDWKDWSDCSVLCDGGTKSRTRQCDDPVPQHGGRYCKGPAQEIAECNTDACPATVASWSDWGSWTTCQMHGSRGSHYRSRTCLNTHLGNCPGLDREYDYCTSKGDFSKEGTLYRAIHVSHSTLANYETSKVMDKLSVQPTPDIPIDVRCAMKCQDKRMDVANTGGCNSFYVDFDSQICSFGVAELDWYYQSRLEGASDGLLFIDALLD